MEYHQETEDAAERQTLEREQRLESTRRMLATREGRDFVWRVLDRAGIFALSYTGDQETFFREGQRNIGLFVLDDVLAAEPDILHKLMKENYARTD